MLRWMVRRMCSSSTESVASSISDIMQNKPLGTTRTVKGWVKSVRQYKDVTFVDVSDGSCPKHLQVVLTGPDTDLSWGTSINATGRVQENERGQVELAATNLNVIGKCVIADQYPFAPKQKQAYDHYRQYLHLRPQIQTFTSLFRFRNAATHRIHNYFQENNFVEIHAPIITSNDCEGGGELFRVQLKSEKLAKSMRKEFISVENAFFDVPSYLTVSGQIHLECLIRSISKVYSFGPCFRAENSKSRFHLSEFYMVESEEAFVTDLSALIERMESLFKYVTSFLLEKHFEELLVVLKHNNSDIQKHLELLESLIEKPFVVMKFDEAKKIIKENDSKIKRSTQSCDHNFTKEEELFLVEHNDNVPLFVVDWPKIDKAFYMKELPEGDKVSNVDLLMPNLGELCGGSLREDDHDVLFKKLFDLKLYDDLKWYLELRKFRNVPSGGFGMGFERYLQFVLNVQNIKDTVPFPRWPHNLQL